MKIKYFSFLTLTALILSLGWFLFFKKYDYQINFTVKTSPGTVFSKIQELESWTNTRNEKNIEIINKTAFENIRQQINLKDSTYIFNWDIRSLNDSITKISIDILDKDNSKKQRILSLFGASDFIKKSILRIKDFKKVLEDHTKIFSVEIVGESTKPAFDALIYVTFKTSLIEKAHAMMQNNYYLAQYMQAHQLKKTGYAFINVVKWNLQKDSITCQFSFPVEKREFYPEDEKVKVKINVPAQKSLKAIFHGNYINSDRAWFALYNYAKRHKINVENRPLERFLNNPYNGGEDTKWQANIYLPIIN